jgi:hypothetical protein
MNVIERNARQIEKLNRESAIAAILPRQPRVIVSHKDHVALIYTPESFADILAIFDAFTPAPSFVVKRERYAASVKRDETPDAETIVSDAFAWIVADQSESLSPRLSFRMNATLSDGTPATIHVNCDRFGLFHSDFAARFTCDNPRRRPENRTYHATPAPFMGLAAYVWRAAGARRDGGELIQSGVFMTRDCLARALETLA